MEEGTAKPAPLFNPDSEEECENHLDPMDDVEMNDKESGTFRAREDETPVLLSFTSSLFSKDRDPLLNLPFEIRPLPRRTSYAQDQRNKMERVDNNGTSSITLAPQHHASGSAGTVVLFHRNPDSPLFKVGDKRPAQAQDEEHRKQEDARRKHQAHVSVRAIQLRDNFVC